LPDRRWSNPAGRPATPRSAAAPWSCSPAASPIRRSSMPAAQRPSARAAPISVRKSRAAGSSITAPPPASPSSPDRRWSNPAAPRATPSSPAAAPRFCSPVAR